MKLTLILFALMTAFTVHAANIPWVTIKVIVKSHHGESEKLTLKIEKEGKSRRLIVDDINLPETRILTNRQDLDTIINFDESEKNKSCGLERFTYVKTIQGVNTEISGCPASLSFQQLRKSFQNISAIK